MPISLRIEVGKGDIDSKFQQGIVYLNTHHLYQDWMSPLNVALNTKNRSVKDKRQKNSSLLSSDMRGDYTLKPLAYGVYHRDILLVEIFEATLY